MRRVPIDCASLPLDQRLRAAKRLRARILPAGQLGDAEVSRMFALMRTYYDDISREQLLADLRKKDDVILLLDDGGEIQGFSTLVTVSLHHQGKEHRGIFSGDTVVEKAFWGERTLGKAFLRYLFVKKLRRPIQPLYWLLISKGYKTYLMMANNFTEYYPRRDAATPLDRKALMDGFYAKLFADEYEAARGLVTPRREACHLKAEIAAISEQLLAANAKIAFFQRANPDWQRGVELACLARMTLWMPAQYGLKVWLKDRLGKPWRRLRQAIGGRLFRLSAEEKRKP